MPVMSGTGRSIGVVLVHGIGNQKPGQTVSRFVDGLGTILAEDVRYTRRDPDRVIVEIRGIEFKIYETWWADAFGETYKTFRSIWLNALPWFPVLNLLHRQYDSRPVIRSTLWLVLLAPLMIPIQFMLQIGLRALRISDLQDVVDDVIGDVPNYLESAAHALPPMSKFVGTADVIQGRLAATLDRAAKETDEIILVGHSLGSVIAYHSIINLLGASPGGAGNRAGGANVHAKIGTFVTIGSPLEKIRWLWPTTVSMDYAGGHHARPTWLNLRDRLDLVATRIHHKRSFGDVTDIALIGRAWLGTAHTAYQLNPEFFRVILSRGGIPNPRLKKLPPATRVELFCKSIALSVATILMSPIAFAVVLFILVVGVYITVFILGVLGNMTDASQNVGVYDAARSHGVNISIGHSLEQVILIAFVAVAAIAFLWGWIDAAVTARAFRDRSSRAADPATRVALDMPPTADAPEPIGDG